MEKLLRQEWIGYKSDSVTVKGEVNVTVAVSVKGRRGLCGGYCFGEGMERLCGGCWFGEGKEVWGDSVIVCSDLLR